jgi:hypothetical protein
MGSNPPATLARLSTLDSDGSEPASLRQQCIISSTTRSAACSTLPHAETHTVHRPTFLRGNTLEEVAGSLKSAHENGFDREKGEPSNRPLPVSVHRRDRLEHQDGPFPGPSPVPFSQGSHDLRSPWERPFSGKTLSCRRASHVNGTLEALAVSPSPYEFFRCGTWVGLPQRCSSTPVRSP